MICVIVLSDCSHVSYSVAFTSEGCQHFPSSSVNRRGYAAVHISNYQKQVANQEKLRRSVGQFMSQHMKSTNNGPSNLALRVA